MMTYGVSPTKVGRMDSGSDRRSPDDERTARDRLEAARRTLADLSRAFASPPTWRGWRGYLLAALAVAAALGLRQILDLFGTFYYLPMVPPVVLTALLSRRAPTAAAIALSILVNVEVTPREGLTDTVINAALFVVVSWVVAELWWAQRRVHRRVLDLDRSLAGRNALLDTVLTSMPVVVLDRSGRVRRMTPAASEIFGVEAKEAEGRPFGRFIHGFSMDRIHPGARGRTATASPEHWIGRRPDGRPLIVSLQAGVTPAPTDDYAALCLIDVTETHAANERLRDLDTQLNRIWRLNSLGEMAATLAHELNQPLSAAATYMQASQRDIEKAGLLGQSAGRSLEMAKAQVLRAGAIIRRMRDLLTTGTHALNGERVSSMIEDLAPALAMIGRDRGVEIRTEIDGRDDQVRAERIQFQQALINLVRNAVDAVQDRPAPVVLLTGRPVADDLYRITVEDSGPGIPPDQIEHIFRPMTTTKSTGMGLGLSVTRTIVESHGGSLEVGGSRLGGAAFQFDIPRELEDA